MRKCLVAAAAVALTGAAFAQQSDNYFDGKELGEFVSQAQYEAFMTCAGNHVGALDTLARIGPASTKPDAMKEAEEQGRSIYAQLEDVMADLDDPRVKLDRTAGQAALQAGRKKFDDLANASWNEQFAAYRDHGKISDQCATDLETVMTVAAIQKAALDDLDKAAAGQ
ncbi:MAG: hypothetical protein R3C52_04995 [Hyphomonadaceae bacterium]